VPPPLYLQRRYSPWTGDRDRVEDRQICFLYVTDVVMGGGTVLGENFSLISTWMVLCNK